MIVSTMSLLEREGERGRGKKNERNGLAFFLAAGSLSGSHRSSDITNGVNVLACLQYPAA